MLKLKILWAAASDLPAGWPMLVHSHASYHLFYIRSGKATFVIDGQKYNVSSGDCVIASPHMFHGIPDRTHSLLDVYELKFTLSEPAINSLLKQTEPVIHGGIANMEQTLQYIIHTWAANNGSQQDIAETLLSSLLLTIQMNLTIIPEQVSTYIDTSNYGTLTRKIIQYLEDAHTEPFCLDDLAKELGYNKRYLCSHFKQETSITIVDFLNHIRIRHATQCFYYHDVPVSITAQHVGFSTPLHFSRVFKQLVGISPSEFRQQYNLNKVDSSESKRFETICLSKYERILGVKRLPLKESVQALRELGE